MKRPLVAAGAVALLPALLLAACSARESPPPVTLAVRAVAGPVCPVETDPPKPECADRPVAGAVIVIRDAGGNEAARVPTGEDGTFSLDLLPGDYLVEPQPVEGLLGTAPLVQVTLAAAPVAVTVTYDTGIR